MKGIKGLALGAIAVAGLSLSSCIMIHSSSISDMTGTGTAISATADDMGILHVVIPDNLTQKANSELTTQCKSGKMTDVTTELTMRDILIVQLYEISVSALCQ
jgi:hypothetical protein